MVDGYVLLRFTWEDVFLRPEYVLRTVLEVLHPLGLAQYGPEQVDFLRYRPVLDNRRLKEVFGYIPRLTSAEAYERELSQLP